MQSQGIKRKIIHVDMDCFYAAVEEKFNPSLKGKAVGIGGAPNSRSVLCTANYEARKFGVRAAMPSSQAVRRCPHLILIPPHFDLYKAESKKVREIFSRYTDKIEPLSLDEAYLDVTGSQHFSGSATRIAEAIRNDIFKELKLTASAGISNCKFLAKIASDWKKPNGQFVIKPEDINDFMPNLPVERIFGVGKVTAKKMHELGFKTCGDLQKKSLTELAQIFGLNRAQDLYGLSRGIDEREVKTNWERKSLSVEETFNQDISDLKGLEKILPQIFEDFSGRLGRGDYGTKIRGIVVKVKYADFKSSTHESSFQGVPQMQDFLRLLREAWSRRSDPIRLLGIGVRLGVTERRQDLQQLVFDVA